MKKIIILITIASILALTLSTFVSADDGSSLPQWFKDMISWRMAQIDQGVKDNTITEDQAQLYRDHIDQMEKFHESNGFPAGMGMGFGGCRGNGAGYGFRGGMMGAYPSN